jgi:hypothetical protein
MFLEFVLEIRRNQKFNVQCIYLMINFIRKFVYYIFHLLFIIKVTQFNIQYLFELLKRYSVFILYIFILLSNL